MASRFLVEHCNRQVEIRGEGHPENIRNKQEPCRLFDAVKKNCVDNNYHPKGEKPDESKGVPAEVKKPYAPEEIERKPYGENCQGGCQSVLGRSRIDDEIKGYAHKSEKDRPNDREKPTGRREGRLIQGRKCVHTAHCQKSRKTSYAERDRKAYQ